MDGDYIELTRADHDGDVLPALIELLRPIAVDGGVRCFPVLTLEHGAELFVDECGDGLVRLAIADTHSNPAWRRMAARRVYRTLFERTGWALCWTADDVPAVIEQRLFPTGRHILGVAS